MEGLERLQISQFNLTNLTKTLELVEQVAHYNQY
jgi:hypothetical protein